MRENYDDRVEEWWPLKNGSLIVKLEEDESCDDHDITKKTNEMPCQLRSCILGQSERSVKKVNREIDGFYNKKIYYRDTVSVYNHKKQWSRLVEKSYIRKVLGLVKNSYDSSGIRGF